MYGAFGVAAALADKARTGRGTVVRTSLLAAIVGVHAFQGTRWTVAYEVPRAAGNHHPSIAPYGAFRTGDGIIQVAVGNHAQWRALCGVVGLDAADARFVTARDRVAHRHDLVEALERRLAERSAGEWLALLADAGVPAGKARTLDDVCTWEQTRSQGLLIDVDHPVLGRVQLPGPPLRLETRDGRDRGRQLHAAPPLLGQHDQQILAWLEEES
jgi:crotonobetainyl-CoA:carnitine CoA-transferase CaiB-like acyl-CoA transferase